MPGMDSGETDKLAQYFLRLLSKAPDFKDPSCYLLMDNSCTDQRPIDFFPRFQMALFSNVDLWPQALKSATATGNEAVS
jgi:hypothetical protein